MISHDHIEWRCRLEGPNGLLLHLFSMFLCFYDFNKANLKKSLPNFHQHVSCCTRGPNTLDHCYTTIKNAYRSIPRPHFGKSDHTAVLLLPAYRQQLKSAPPEVRTVQSWSGGGWGGGGRGTTTGLFGVCRLGNVQGLGNGLERIRHSRYRLH